jgi:3-oxoacyl-[acyl-carrier-protein] synthase II
MDATRTRNTPRIDDVVVTGAGLVTCLGLDRNTTWRAVCAGACGIKPLTAIEPAVARVNKGGGEAPPLPDIEPGTPREVAYLRRAFEEALTEAGAWRTLPVASNRCGFIVGTTLHGMRSGGQFLRTGDASATRHFLAGDTLRLVMNRVGITGVVTTVCSACSSGLGAIALATTLLKTGRLDLAVTGGYDPISEYAYGGFNSMRLVTDGLVKPFARDRTGMKIGEGYGLIVLERAGDASARGVKPLATVAGFGESCDAFHLSKPHPQGDGAVRAIHEALSMAGISPHDVNMIAAHATATPDNDAAEYTALRRVFGDALGDIPVVAFKSHIAHTLGGAGAVELILSLCALRDQTVPPCANLTADDVTFQGLRPATGDAQRARLTYTLNTSLGFGGSNTCLVLRSPDSRAVSRFSSMPSGSATRVVITGVGVVAPGAIGNVAFMERLAAERPDPITMQAEHDHEPDLDELLSARRVRRMSTYVKLTLAATSLAYRDAGITDQESFGKTCYAILGTTHGSTVYCERYYRQLIEQGVDGANPLLFAEGVPNAAAAHLSMMMSIRGLCQTVIGTRRAGLDALILATERIRAGLWQRAVVGAADEVGQVVDSAYRHFGLCRVRPDEPIRRKSQGFTTGWGAVTFLVESESAASDRSARVLGYIDRAAGEHRAVGHARDFIDGVTRVLIELENPSLVLSSANDTWIDRMERAAIRRAGCTGPALGAAPGRRHVGAIYGWMSECFSVNPLAALAAVLLAGAGSRGGPVPRFLQGPNGDSAGLDHAGVICTDYSGGVSGVRISLPRGPTAAEKARLPL